MHALDRSRLLLMEKSSASRPIAFTAACTSLTKGPPTAAVLGLMRTANRSAPGTSSCKSPNRFAVSSSAMLVTPVTFAPGRLRLRTRPDVVLFPGDSHTYKDYRALATWYKDQVDAGVGRGSEEGLFFCVCVNYGSSVGDANYQTGFISSHCETSARPCSGLASKTPRFRLRNCGSV